MVANPSQCKQHFFIRLQPQTLTIWVLKCKKADRYHLVNKGGKQIGIFSNRELVPFQIESSMTSAKLT